MTCENIVNKAVAFAAEAHDGQLRKGSEMPYIVHPIEAAAICASFTDDIEVIAAALLHDVVEDSDATIEEVEEFFGKRVAALVAGESEDKREGLPPEETWRIRKEESIEHLKTAADPGVRMVCLGDKLSNIRSIQRDFEELGDGLWQRFNQKDPAQHAWYYRSIADVLEGELGETDAWQEYTSRVESVFGPAGAEGGTAGKSPNRGETEADEGAPDEFFNFDAVRRENAEYCERRKREALARGAEPYDVDEALKYYYPDTLSGNEDDIRRRMESLESDYYGSGARTLREWAEERERYDVYKDSTGHD